MASLNFSQFDYESFTSADEEKEFISYEDLVDLLVIYQRNMSRNQTTNQNIYMRELITHYIMGIGGVSVACLGVIGNVLSLIVLNQRAFNSPTYSYLSALSVCDTMMLVSTIVLLWKDLKQPDMTSTRWAWDEGMYPYLFPYFHAAAFTFQVISIWLTLAFTVDRYLMICHPYSADRYCSKSRARKVIAGLTIAGIIFNMPKFFEYTTVSVDIPFENITRIGCDLTALGSSRVFKELYHSWFYIVFVCGVPFLTLAVLNMYLMQAVRDSRRRGKAIKAAERKRIDTTVMLISVVIVFFLCQTTALVSRIIWAFNSDNSAAFTKLPLFVLNEVGNLLIIVNSSINIVPYYFFGKRYRSQFYKLYCRCFIDKSCSCIRHGMCWLPALVYQPRSLNTRSMADEDSRGESRHRLSMTPRHSVFITMTNGKKRENEQTYDRGGNVGLPTVAVAVALPGHRVSENGVFSTKTRLVDKTPPDDSTSNKEDDTLIKSDIDLQVTFTKV